MNRMDKFENRVLKSFAFTYKHRNHILRKDNTLSGYFTKNRKKQYQGVQYSREFLIEKRNRRAVPAAQRRLAGEPRAKPGENEFGEWRRRAAAAGLWAEGEAG